MLITSPRERVAGRTIRATALVGVVDGPVDLFQGVSMPVFTHTPKVIRLRATMYYDVAPAKASGVIAINCTRRLKCPALEAPAVILKRMDVGAAPVNANRAFLVQCRVEGRISAGTIEMHGGTITDLEWLAGASKIRLVHVTVCGRSVTVDATSLEQVKNHANNTLPL